MQERLKPRPLKSASGILVDARNGVTALKLKNLYFWKKKSLGIWSLLAHIGPFPETGRSLAW
jgi:hypothetical protein